MIGMPGSGKSTLGKILASRIGYDFLDTDDLLIAHYQKPLMHIIEERGVEGFIQAEGEILQTVQVSHTVLATGGSAVIFIIVSILVYRLKCFCILNCYQNKLQKAHVLAESFSVGAWAFCRFIVYGNVMSRFVRIAIHAECFPLKGIHSVQWCGLHTVRIVVCADHIVLAAWCSCGRQRLVSGGCRHGLQYQIHHI